VTSISAMAPLRSPNFRWYFLSRAVNLAGTTMAPVALAFGVLEVSDSPSALGTVLAAHMVPVVLLLLLGGVLADRLGRRRVIQASNVLSGLTQGTIALLLLSGSAELWHLVVLSAVNGVASAAAMPALNGILPQLVPREHLQQANALQSFTRSGLMIAGPSISAGLVVSAGPGWALLVDAATWLIAAALLLNVRIPPPAGESGTLIADLQAGWAFFRSTTWLWLVVVVFGCLNALHEGAFNTLGPVRATETALGERGWGLALSAQAVGALAATLVLLRRRIERPLVLGMLGNTLYGVPILVLGLWPGTVPLMLVSFVAGAGIVAFSLSWHLAMQENIPEEMLSRAYSYDQLGSFAAIPVGQLAVGPLAHAFGAVPVLVVAGVAYVVVSLLTLLSREVRLLDRVTPTSAPAS